MTLLPLLALTLGAAHTPVHDHVAAAIHEGLLQRSPTGVTRIEVTAHRDRLAADCQVATALPLGPVLGSGEVTFKLAGKLESRDGRGEACAGWSWAAVRLFSLALVTSQRIATGEPLAGAYVPNERELTPGHTFVQAPASDAVAAYTLQPGVALEPQNMRSPAQIPGRTIAVELRSGDLVVETQGHTVPCSLDAACAMLATGKQVAGTWTNGRLEVSLP
jgi:hypothetical protein